MNKSIFLTVAWVVLIAIFLIGLFCFIKSCMLLYKQKESEEEERASNKHAIFLSAGAVLIAVALVFLLLINNWPISVRIGIIVAASALPLLWAAYYSRASLLYDRKGEPAALSLGMLGTILALFGGDAIFYPFHLPLGFSLLYSIGVVYLIVLATGLLQMHWQQLRRQRQLFEEPDLEAVMNDEKGLSILRGNLRKGLLRVCPAFPLKDRESEKEAEEEWDALRWLLFLGLCLLIAAGVPVILFTQGVPLIWGAVIICSLSAGFIFWGEYRVRAHLLYGEKPIPGMGWAIFLGVLLLFFSIFIYIPLDKPFFDFIYFLFTSLALWGQAKLSQRWRERGEQMGRLSSE